MSMNREGAYGTGWTVFEVQVGTPPQTLELLPASSQSTIWAVSPDGCTGQSQDSTSCNYYRGYTFQSNVSSSYQLAAANTSLDYGTTAAAEGYSGTAAIGYDNITLPVLNGSNAMPASLAHQTIETFSALYPYNGLIGLGVTTNDSVGNTSLLESLRQVGSISSLSWSYTNGATYAFDDMMEVEGSLTLGGYDTTRFVPNNVSFPLRSNIPGQLVVGLTAMTTDLHTNLSSNTVLLPDAIYATIDPLLTELWLPLAACKLFESAFNLTWNDTAQLYIMDANTSLSLNQANPNVTISVAPTLSSDTYVNIVFPYKAFQETIGPPFLDSYRLVFPLKRASSQSQYALGRTFMQQAYVVTDYERNSFSVYEALFPNTTSTAPNLVAIRSPEKASNHSGLSGGAIAGIVIGCVAAVGILAVLLFFVLRRRKRGEKEAFFAEKDISKSPSPVAEEQEEQPSQAPVIPVTPVIPIMPVELDATETARAEVPATEPPAELAGSSVPELEGPVNSTWMRAYASTPITDEKSPTQHAMFDAESPLSIPPPYSGHNSPTDPHSSPDPVVPAPVSDQPRRRFSWESEEAG